MGHAVVGWSIQELGVGYAGGRVGHVVGCVGVDHAGSRGSWVGDAGLG